MINKGIYILGILFLVSCGDKVKVIEPTDGGQQNYSETKATGVFEKSGHNDKATKPGGSQQWANEVHNVEIIESLPTEKYVYLRVKEEGEEFWIATGKQEVEIGGKYFFKNGLLKTKFESKEYGRVFDKVYLVSKLVPAGHANQTKIQAATNNETKETIKTSRIKPVQGSIAIQEVIENAKELEGKQIQVTGKCTKLNANIMGRNWIHIKDGSQDEYDFVITSDQPIPEGHVVTMEGTVVLDRDFGAGYRYDLIIENGRIIQ